VTTQAIPLHPGCPGHCIRVADELAPVEEDAHAENMTDYEVPNRINHESEVQLPADQSNT
jgi:hypothetical protein